MEQMKCTVERITYQNAENGYSIFRVKEEKKDEIQTIVGSFPSISVGTTLIVDGEWKVHPTYGEQFHVSKWVESVPSTVSGIENYLASGMIKGIGKVHAKSIVDKFGLDTLDVIENTPEKLLDVKGIGKKRIEQIKTGWNEQKEIRNVMVFLQGYGINPSHAVKIYKQYGNSSITKVKENPYRLADDIHGFGFKTADAIASAMGYSKESPMRLKSGLIYTLNKISQSGHVFATRDQLIYMAGYLLEVSQDLLPPAIDSLILENRLISDENDLYLPLFYHSEKNAAKRLTEILNGKVKKNLPKEPDIRIIEQDCQITYDEIQANAIRQAMQSKVMILTGGPGTGKSTTLLGIISAFQEYNQTVLLAAPTGRAAKRMTETTGMEAKTIHRLLEIGPNGKFQRNKDNPLHGDVLIIDESSMIDILLANSLLNAVPDSMRVIFVGDIDQLPSVGPGNVLRDMIKSNVIPVIRLTRIFRQALSSRIVTNAHKINKGEFPDISNGKQSDFFFIQQDDPEKAAAYITRLVKEKLPRTYSISPYDIQVLAPSKKGHAGVNHLNEMIQQTVNPEAISFSHAGVSIGENDKVMQICNDYEKQIFNGDIGVVSMVNTSEKTLSINFDGAVIGYEQSELDEVSLAYAATIHKSQGSEYPIVIIPLLWCDYRMLERNLLYTGVTRAKKICIIVGSVKALRRCIDNNTVKQRNTKLAQRIQEYYL